MKIQIKAIKEWLAWILTVAVILLLFGLIFVRTGIVTPSPSFFLELGIIATITFLMKLWWYNYAEEKRLSEDDIKNEKDNYFKIVDTVIEDTNDLEKYLVILNQENRQIFIENTLGSRTAETLQTRKWYILMWHPSWWKKSKEEIGNIRYAKLYYKTLRKADKLDQVKSIQIMALSDAKQLYDATNHLKIKKRNFHIFTTILSFVFVTALSMMGIEQILLNWANIIRFVGYLVAIIWTIAYSLIIGYKQTGEETFDYYNRLKFIVDKYATYKEQEERENG